MLHEILLSLSGHPSPLLSPSPTDTQAQHPQSPLSCLTPPERSLLTSLARLSTLHISLQTSSAQLASSHPSLIARTVASAIDTVHLSAFRQTVLEVERKLLTGDAGLVGGYGIVPLTAVVGEFEGWGRRLEWLGEVVGYLEKGGPNGGWAMGVGVMNWLRGQMVTGFGDVQEAAGRLVSVAEEAWLKLVAAWVLYGRVPSAGEGDFFVRRGEEGDEFMTDPTLLPSFVTPHTASSILFIGRSLNQLRAKAVADHTLRGTDHLSSQLTKLSSLQHPLDSATFSAAIADIRLHLSRHTLQRLLPLPRVLDLLQLLRDFFLLRRGDFAIALTQTAGEKMASRWRRADNLAIYENRRESTGLGGVTLKEGEIAAVLSKTWAAMGAMQGSQAYTDEDESVERARGLLKLSIVKNRPGTPASFTGGDGGILAAIASTPFKNLLFSVPVVLTMDVPSPLDLFLTPADLQVYSAVNAYLLSLRRAHIKLTELWKISALRRHHPAPPGPSDRNRGRTRLLRGRFDGRERVLRNVWATASAAIFFLGEVEAYLQTEVVDVLEEGFVRWVRGEETTSRPGTRATSPSLSRRGDPPEDGHDHDQDPTKFRDPQSLQTFHHLYLTRLTHSLLLTSPLFTDALYETLVHIDRLVALITRLHAVWAAADLEEDAGVVDAFVDLVKEERDVRGELDEVQKEVRRGVEGVVGVLRDMEGRFGAEGDEGEKEGGEDVVMRERGEYVPGRVGGVERLVMKLDFGSWFQGAGTGNGIGGKGVGEDEEMF